MKKKYVIGIILIAIIAFAGIEIFRKNDHEETNNNTINVNSEDINTSLNFNTTTDNSSTSNKTESSSKVEEKTTEETTEKITNGEELMEKAKTITASGWAGASNNVIGLKDNILYYYNKGTGEFEIIAEGVEDIYSKTEYPEEITAKKGKDFKEIKEKPIFVEYE